MPIPRPVEALPCGSRSIRIVGWPSIAKAAATIQTEVTHAASTAATPEDIIAETAAATISERSATRMDDQVSEAAMEQRKTIEELSAEITAKGSLPRATG